MKHSKSVLANLAISYLTIVIVIVLFLCSVFYLYFPRNYKEEIRNKNQIILENAANYIESAVFQRVQQIYLDLSLENSVNIDLYTKETLQGNHSRIIDIQDLLKKEVTNNSDIVYAVHLFYPLQKVLISSVYGLKYYDEASKDTFATMDWIDKMQGNDTGFVWNEVRMVPQDINTNVSSNNSMNPLISYAHSFPFNSTGEQSKLIIAIDIKEAAVSEIIRNVMPSDYANTFIIGESGQIISAADDRILGSRTDNNAYITKILSSNTAADSFTDTINQIPSVVSYHNFTTNKWKIYNVTSTDDYYSKSILLQKVVLLICLLTIIMGIILSGMFTIAIYNPLQRLMSRIKGLFDTVPDAERNEYTLIGTAFNTLTHKVSSLEETLQANNPVIKHNVVLNMLRNSYSSEELAEQLYSLHISMEYANFCCMVIDPVSKGIEPLSPKSSQYVIYRLINQLEAIDFHESQLIAEELPDRKIAVIVCTNHLEEGLLEQLSRFIYSEVNPGVDQYCQLAVGQWVQQFVDVHRSFAEAQQLIKYAYFLPEIAMIQDLTLLNREHSNNEIPQAFLLKFKEKLQARNIDEVTAAIDHLIVHLREGMYSADYCHIILLNMVSMYSEGLKSVQYKPSGSLKLDVYKQHAFIQNIVGFREWLVNSIAAFYIYMEQRSEERNVESIETVKEYISKHLSEELSLDIVAGNVFISPKYLSKIFKEETGINYIDYVTDKRMEKALELMASTDMTVEQIANTVGYGSSAYFIKKFKGINGCTPKDYTRNLIKQA
ncbi:AraC family transcriptional regulator [Paenibacillus sp. 19GGS1-52]|uniref:helix-turn-helix domain-containing protein n=1 Tax=Paenibacillus sp. 19GGS1-52 TaxID=2758563 RepID=UPI001EFC1B6B|nr:helix-turn-helix domain-containing protein [Paenibacillus sp. 19GGS1-52]ULO07683.1 AraC family transcriptional regulator [Paenibacillus sp. 19GGS1-52]